MIKNQRQLHFFFKTSLFIADSLEVLVVFPLDRMVVSMIQTVVDASDGDGGLSYGFEAASHFFLDIFYLFLL